MITMTVWIRDVYDGLETNRAKLEVLDFCELMYADDAAVITNNVNAMDRLLAKIESCANKSE